MWLDLYASEPPSLLLSISLFDVYFVRMNLYFTLDVCLCSFPPLPKFLFVLMSSSSPLCFRFPFPLFFVSFFCARLLSLMLTLTLSMVYCIYIYIYLSSFNFFNLLNLGGGLWFFYLWLWSWPVYVLDEMIRMIHRCTNEKKVFSPFPSPPSLIPHFLCPFSVFINLFFVMNIECTYTLKKNCLIRSRNQRSW